MSTASEYAGQAALSICEALLLALTESGVLPEREVLGVLRDAAATHENAAETEPEPQDHQAVADLINTILVAGHSARRL